MIIKDNYKYTYKRKHDRLHVACIMDEFTYKCFSYECELTQITPNNWNEELESIDPDFVFIESAWGGKDDLWGGKLITPYAEIGELADYCAKEFIPVVFWNKEDPYGYDAFLNMAKISDVILTTASECIDQYKKDTNNQNVYFMHFAAQPKMLEEHINCDRIDKFCFAGAYYKQFPKRNEIFEKIYDALTDYKGVDIYDRFYKDKERQFPEKYNKSVIGNLKYDEIYKAYCGYKYNININSITESETMFARRVFELMYSKTLVISNYSKGLVNYFGDLVVCSDNPNEILEKLKEINSSEENYNAFINKAYKRIIDKELYFHRLQQICSILFEK